MLRSVALLLVFVSVTAAAAIAEADAEPNLQGKLLVVVLMMIINR